MHLPEARAYGLGVGGLRARLGLPAPRPARAAGPAAARPAGRPGRRDRAPRGPARRRDAVPAQGGARAVRSRWSPTSAYGCRRTSPRRAARCWPRCRGRRCARCSRPPRRSSTAPAWGRAPRDELRALLAAEAARGWSEEDGHVTAGIASVAAAARDRTGRPVAAVGVTFASDRRPPLRGRAELAADVVATAEALARRLGPPLTPRPCCHVARAQARSRRGLGRRDLATHGVYTSAASVTSRETAARTAETPGPPRSQRHRRPSRRPPVRQPPRGDGMHLNPGDTAWVLAAPRWCCS